MKVKKILVSQPKPAAGKSPYYDIAQKYGLEIDFHPFIKVVSVPAQEFKEQKISVLDHTAAIFTSRHSIDHFFTICNELRLEIPDTMKYFCNSEAISLYIQKYTQYRKRKIFFGKTGKFDGVLPLILKNKKEKFIIPVSDVHNSEIKNTLESNNIPLTEAVMYRTVSNEFDKNKKLDHDMLIFFSPSGVVSLKENFPEFEQKEVCIASFGKNTAQAVKDAGLRLDLEAPTEKSPSMTAALEEFLKKNK